jgi:large subunit ribosomal protein L29
MEVKEIQEKTDAELNKLLAQYREKQRDLHFRIARKELKNHQEYKMVRRDIARVKTLLRQRIIAAQESN